MNRAILNTGAAHNAAGPNLSRSTNRSATGKSEKNNEHQKPEQDVAHNLCPSPCGIVNRTTPISKQKMFPRGGSRRVSGIGARVSGKNKKEWRDLSPLLFQWSCPLSFPIPDTLSPRPYLSKMAIASISIIASGFTSAFTTTPVAEGNPFLKYFLRTAAVSLYRSRVVT